MNQFKRLSIQAYGALLALAASQRSEDWVTQVGACILNKKGEVVSTGFNGWAPGMKVDEKINLEENRDKKSKLILHAESNAIFRLNGKDAHSLYLSFNPCSLCAKMIASTTIKEVYYFRIYEKYRGFEEIFDFYGISYKLISKSDLDDIQNSLEVLLNLVKSL